MADSDQLVNTRKPSARSPSIMTSVSSLRNAPKRVRSVPRAVRAASTSARLVILFEPGTRTVPTRGWLRGTISRASASLLIRYPHQEQPLRRRRRPRLSPVLSVQDLRNLRLGPETAAHVHQRPGNGPHHIVEKAIGLHVQPQPVA